MIPPLPSGLAGFLTDAREFLLAIRFARPELLLAMLVLPVFALLNTHAAKRRRKSSDAVGRPAAIAGLQTHPRPTRRWIGTAYPLAWVVLVLGLAGPRWGKSDETGVAVGRDVVLVLDLSRSMLATDLSAGNDARWQAGRAGLLDLMATIRARGGHRVAVVVFAARPKLLVPLTTDYDHVTAVIEEIDGAHPPPDCRPGADPTVVSGTRIGAALQAAVAAHDPRFRGSQDIILVSDGDDPAGDKEWVRGADAARAVGIPVHCVGVGDPAGDTLLTVNNELLEFQPRDDLAPDFVRTKLEEESLKQVAAETRGQYVAARKDTPRLSEFFRAVVEPFPSRQVSDDSVSRLRDRAAWFLAAALALFAVGWVRGR